MLKVTLKQTVCNYGPYSFVVKTTELKSKKSDIFVTQIFECIKHIEEDCKNPDRFINREDRYWKMSNNLESAIMKHDRLTSEFVSLVDSGEILGEEEDEFWWQKD